MAFIMENNCFYVLKSVEILQHHCMWFKFLCLLKLVIYDAAFLETCVDKRNLLEVSGEMLQCPAVTYNGLRNTLQL